MEYGEAASQLVRLVGELSSVGVGTQLPSVVHLVEHGEPEEALDLLVAILVRRNVPISIGQRDLLRSLMRHFESRDNGGPTYPYLDDPEMLDRMTVVDESS